MNYLKTYFFDIIFKKGFDFTGRATRKEFWLFTLNLLIVISAIYYIIYFDLPKISPEIFNKALNLYPSYDTVIFIKIIFTLMFLSPLLFVLPFINLLARRLHDIGWSAKCLFFAVLLLRYAWIFPCIIGFIPGKKEGNKYDNQNKNENIIKKSLVNGTILILILLLLFSFITALIKPTQRRKADCNRIINDIAKAELKYFKENNDFLYVYKTDNNDILNINLQQDDGFDTFSCTVNNDNIDNKSVEIKVWSKNDAKQKEKLKDMKDSYYVGYVCATQYQNGDLTKTMLKFEKKTAE